jgi:hypothetical protein
VAKHTKLPIFTDTSRTADSLRKTAPDPRPSLEDARNRLGGRTLGERPGPLGVGPGAVVSVLANDASRHAAVVVFANANEVHVLIDGTRLRRVPPGAIEPKDGATPDSLAGIAADAQVFARLAEGQPVRYADDKGGLLDGTLLEKCRYGALIVRGDGAVVAVGFRKLWPALNAGAA